MLSRRAHGNNMVHYTFLRLNCITEYIQYYMSTSMAWVFFPRLFFSPHGKSKVITGQLWFGHLWCRHIGLSVRQRAKSFQMFWNVVNTQTHKQEKKYLTIGKSQFVFSLRELQSALFSVLSRVAH